MINKLYKFGLIIIILVFILLELSYLKQASYSSSKFNYFNSLDNAVLLQKPQSLEDKKYLTNELLDVNEIKLIFNKLKNNTSEISIVNIKNKNRPGKNSIYVQALQSISLANRRGYSSIRGVDFNLKDPVSGNLIRPSTMLETHATCGKEILKLPRKIVREDEKIKFDLNFFDIFMKRHQTVFGYNLLIEENVSEFDNRGRVKRAKKRLFRKYGDKSEQELRSRLFQNPCIAKIDGCRYRDYPGYVIFYYDILSDLFSVVDSKSKKLLECSIANETDYADIFRYKSVFQNMTSSELIQCPNTQLNPSKPKCKIPEKPTELSRDELLVPNNNRSLEKMIGLLRKELELTEEDRFLNLNNFDEVRNKGLSDDYNLIDGWWLNRQKQIIESLDPIKFARLSIEFKKDGPEKNFITEIEALTILQAEKQNLVGGIFRPDMINIEKERILNFDFKISKYNKQIFIGLKPTYVDIKSPLDPEVIRARNEPELTLEDQVDYILKKIDIQRRRAIENQETVIHIITLLRIKPSERAYFLENFKTKALKQDLNMTGIKFINTSIDRI